MNLKLIPTPEFAQSIKKLYKKYKQIYKDLDLLEKVLFANQKVGIALGNNCFKLRLPNLSKPVGKRGEFRVVYYYRALNNKIFLLSFYSKTDMENIRDNRLLEILKKNELI